MLRCQRLPPGCPADYFSALSRGKAFGALWLTGALGGMLGALYATNMGELSMPAMLWLLRPEAEHYSALSRGRAFWALNSCFALGRVIGAAFATNMGNGGRQQAQQRTSQAVHRLICF